MKPLTIELTKGVKRQFQSVGWQTAKANDCRRHFFALAQDEKALMVTPTIAIPAFYHPNREARAIFSGEPFPEAVCVEISPCRLLAPPCYESREAFAEQLPCHAVFEPWKWFYWQAHREVLIAEPSDDGPLQERLDKWLAVMRAAYECEAALWRDRIKFVTTASLTQLDFESEEQRNKRLSELQVQLDIVESEDSIDGVPCKGRLKLTLADVKRGHEGIRDAWMHEDWAAKNGWDLAKMRRERHVLRHWLETRTGTLANVYDMTTRRDRQEIAPPRFGERFENNPQFLEACAMVRYRARFADNADTVVYLTDCELREELTSAERDELEKLTPAPSKLSLAVASPAATAFLPVPDEQFEYINTAGTEWRKAGPQMVRRRKLAEHHRTTKDDSSFKALLDAHRERWFYPTKKIVAVREAIKRGDGRCTTEEERRATV